MLQGQDGVHHRFPLQAHHRHALGVAGCFGQQLRRGENERSAIAGIHRHLLIGLQGIHRHQRTLVAIGTGELFPVGLRLIGIQRHLGNLAVFKEEQHKAAVVLGQHHADDALPLLHAQFLGQVIPQLGCLAVLKFAQAALVALELVGKHQQVCPVGGLPGEQQAVSLFELLLAAHPQGLGGDFFQVALFGKEHHYRIVGNVLLLVLLLSLRHLIKNFRLSGLTVFLGNLLQLLDNHIFQLSGAGQNLLHVGNLLLQLADCLGLLEDVFLIDIAQLDFRHEIGLNLIDAEANHQVGNNLRFQLGLPDDADGFVDVQQDAFQTFEQMQPLLPLANLEEQAALDAVHPPGSPLLQNLSHAHNPRHSGNEDVEIAGEAILQGGHAEQLLHQLLRLYATL